MGMFSQNELLLMIGVVSVLLLCISILTVLDIKEYLKSKKELGIEEETLNNDSEEEKMDSIMITEVEDEPSTVVQASVDKKEEAFLEEVPEEHIEPEINPIVEESEEIYVSKVVPTKEKVDALAPDSSEILAPVEIKEETKKNDVFEELDEIENNLPNNKDDVTNFEAEQERTAIISLDELMKKSDELYNDNETMQYDDGNEPISIDEVIKMFKRDDDVKVEIEEEKVPEVLQKVVDEKVPYSKKETIPFISSVYGIEKENNSLAFENTATYEKLDRENYNDFVAQLKEMNENK